MSRYQARGINPQNGDTVDIFWGWDEVPGFRPGYFFQVYSRRAEDVEKDGEGIILNLGFLEGISEEELSNLKSKWKAKTRL